MCRPIGRGGFFHRVGLKTGRYVTHVGLESGMVFEGTIRECMKLSFQFQMSKKEREICEFEMALKNFFLLAL